MGLFCERQQAAVREQAALPAEGIGLADTCERLTRRGIVGIQP